MIKVSIIVPTYNGEKYIRTCLDSLINQTLKEIEIICVNDSSPDNSLDVLEKYALNDQRVRIINQPNSGPGIARNNGIAEAKGKYIGFVDPDDWADLDMFEKMSGIEKKSIQRWIPIVAATQMTKKIPEEQEFLSKWINVVDYE